MSWDAYDENQGALQEALSAITGGMVTHYVVVAAVMHEDGDETTQTITSPGLPLWQTHGLLSYEAAASVPQPTWTQGDDE